MLPTMFGIGGSEILVILIVALIFLGPEKLPDAATKISKGIRELRKQTRDIQNTIENDTEIGGAIRDLKSALRGDEIATVNLMVQKNIPVTLVQRVVDDDEEMAAIAERPRVLSTPRSVPATPTPAKRTDPAKPKEAPKGGGVLKKFRA